LEEYAWTDGIKEAPAFSPTVEEFEDPIRYIETIAPEASKFGICKIIPPVKTAVPAGIVLNNKKYTFTTNVQELGVYRPSKFLKEKKFFRSGRTYTLQSFQQMANGAMSKKFGCSGNLPHGIVEKHFWKEMLTYPNTNRVEYGSDVDGTGFSESLSCPLGASAWNLRDFAKCSKSSLKHAQEQIAGVTEPMLYCGMLFSTFAWHVEDSYLNSINYHHLGSPKLWYGVPASDAKDFEKVALSHVLSQEPVKKIDERDLDNAASMFIHKTTMFSPKVLVDNDVKVFKLVHEPGEFVVTFPNAYHGGFSTGFNLGEAVNFATSDWYEHGYWAEMRYHRLRRNPIISVEEILWCDLDYTILQSSKSPCVLKDFLSKITPVWSLIAQFILSIQSTSTCTTHAMPVTGCTIPCSICSGLCYFAMATIGGMNDPVCTKCTQNSILMPGHSKRPINLYLNPKVKKIADVFATHAQLPGREIFARVAELLDRSWDNKVPDSWRRTARKHVDALRQSSSLVDAKCY